MFKDFIASVIIYAAALFVIVPKALNNVISSDLALEYEIYLKELQTGHWSYVPDSIVNSSLFTTLLPAYVQNIFNFPDNTFIFKLWPCLFMAGIPVLTYLIARLYMPKLFSIMAVLFVMTHYYFVLDPLLGRTEAGWFFFSLLAYGLLSSRVKLAIVAAVCLPFAHYGAWMFGLWVLAFLLGYTIIKHKKYELPTMISLNILAVIGFVWLFLIAKTPGHYMLGFLTRYDAPEPELVTAAMQGQLLAVSNNWIRFLWLLSWISFGVVIIGAITQYELYPILFVISVSLIITTLIAFLLPNINYFYGLARVYFTGLPVLAVAFVTGIRWISKKTYVDAWFLAIPFIALHQNISPF